MNPIMYATLYQLSQMSPESFEGDVDAEIVLTEVRQLARDSIARAEQMDSGEIFLRTEIEKLLERTKV